MKTKYYIDDNGKYLGGWDSSPPKDSIEVKEPPEDARQNWNGEKWISIDNSYIDIENLYDSAMSSLQSKYPQTEINTFARKSVAANDFIENNKNAKDSNIYLLAKIDAVVNGVSPLSMEEIAEEIENINDSGWKTIQDRAIKILSAEHQYDFYLAKIEQMRNSALDQLSETEDNTGIVESLTEAYKQLEG